MITSLITGLLIFSISPSDKYLFTKKDTPPILKSLTSPPPSNILFTDLTFQSGLFFTHQQGDHKLTGMNESLGSGACVLDYDNDGWQDLFIVNGSGQNRFYGKLHWWQQQNSHGLFKNIGNHRFINTSKTAGLDISSWGMGCLATDFNNDGYSDLLITTLNHNQLFKNNGDGTFSKINGFAKTLPPAWSTSACAADFNADGFIDLYIANFIDYDKSQLTYEGGSEFTKSQTEFFTPSLFNPVSNRLFINNGDFSFTDITQSSGLTDLSSRSLAVRCSDINNDHLPDIIVANDKGDGSNRLYINQGQLSFLDMSDQLHFQNNTGSRNISIGDINNDGLDELFLTTGVQQNSRLYQSHYSIENKFIYTDSARTWGLTDNISSFQSNWGGGLHDFNQDGLLDFFVVNGFLTPDPDSPRVTKGQPNQLWINNGKQFNALQNIDSTSINSIPESSRSSVFADFDNDGDIDIYITNNNNLGQLLINNTPANTHWLGIQLTDSLNNHNLTGSKVSVTSDLGIQSRTISAGDSFLSDSEDRLLFGLNQDNHIKQLMVTWPNGQQASFNNVSINQYVTIDLTKGIVSNSQVPKTSLVTSLLPNQNTETTVLFLSLLSRLHGIESALPYLHTAVNSQNDLVRKAAINELAHYNHPSTLALLINAINDKSENVAALSLATLCGFEDESTIRWLIHSLSDHRDIIRETGALCFKRLYHEEEAMIHRKYLALPSLINLLTDKKPSIQIAAAKALAEAEHYRAVAPLINSLDSKKRAVRIEVIRALGLIREKEAIPALLSRLNDPTEVPEVFANSLIALKRLDQQNFSKTLDSFVQGLAPFNNINSLQRADTLLYLHTNTLESVVIHPNIIKNIAAKFIKQNITDHNLLLKLIPVIATQNQTDLLTQLSKNSNQEISFKSYKALLSNNYTNKTALINRISQLTSLLLKNKLLSALNRPHIKVSSESLIPFLASSNTAKAAKAAILVLKNSNNRNSALLLSNELTNSSHQALILQSLKNNSFSQQLIATPYLSSKDLIIKQSAYDFYLEKFPQNKLLKQIPSVFIHALNEETKEIREIALMALSNRKELWAIKRLQKIILDTTETITLRLDLLSHFKHPFQKNWVIMLKIANHNNDPIRHSVIQRLSTFNNPEVMQFFKSLASNIDTKENLRNLAFNTLAQNAPKWTFDTLLKQSKEPLVIKK